VRDVLGHLVYLAEATQLGIVRDVLRHGPVPDRALSRMARSLGDRPTSELADRLESSAHRRYHVIGLPLVVAAGDVLVHTCDMRRPLGEPDDIDPAVVAPVLETYRGRVGRLIFHASPATGVTLVADDVGVTLGTGPEVRGRAIDLLLLLANRRQVLGSLTGPGVAALAA
jgi:uncharacterized protein (TIGR03083 family)